MKTFSILMLFIFSSCLPSLDKTSLVFDDGAISTGPLVADGEPVTFEVLKQKLLLPSCIGCHEGAANEDKILGWVVAGEPDESDLYLVIKDASMPKDGALLDSRYLDLVIRYIQSVKAPETPTTSQVDESFENIKEKILVPKCLNCHKKMGDETLLISKWVVAGDPENSKLYTAVVNGSMPKKAERLSDKEIAAIASYIKSLKP